MKAAIESLLSLFPEVVWDRYSGDENSMDAFGWIKRDDGLFDFILLGIKHGKAEYFTTSSAKYTKEFSSRLKFSHSDCKRIENDFPTVKSIKLHR